MHNQRNLTSDQDLKSVSKGLADVLRHKATRFKIQISKDGFASVDEIIQKYFQANKSEYPRMPNIEDIKYVAETSMKD